MITVYCHCDNCGHDYKEEDVRMVLGQGEEYRNRSEEETIKCPKCSTPDIR